MTTNHRNICRRRSKSDGDIKEVFFEKEGIKKIMSEFLELI